MSEREHVERLCADKKWVKGFKSKIVKRKNGCWEWTGGLEKGGYGRFHVKKHCERPTGRNFFAHRMSYMIHRGYITPDEYILHQCHNRLCCNPKHHKLGDHQDNMDDLHDSERVAGENNSRSKLTEDEVWDILDLYWEETNSVAKIKELNSLITRHQIGLITDSHEPKEILKTIQEVISHDKFNEYKI